MLIECTYICSYCLTPNDVSVDPSGGVDQDYVEDCTVCCRPNRLVISVDPGRRSAAIDAAPP